VIKIPPHDCAGGFRTVIAANVYLHAQGERRWPLGTLAARGADARWMTLNTVGLGGACDVYLPQAPENRGDRFSTKAAIPSAKSVEEEVSRWMLASNSSWSSICS
jgi:hypothetical protein